MFIGQGITKLFENAGYTINLSTFDPSVEGVAFIIFNLVVVKPIVEGILFRGVVLRVLSAYGRTFAIAASAILFGLYQGNILQICYALCAGLILGYITFRYSIKYSIILHAIHNALMVGVTYLTPHVPGIAIYGLWGVFTIGLIVVAIRKGSKVKRFLDKGRARVNAWRYTFTVPWLLLYVAITVVLTIVQLDVKEIGSVSENPSPLIPEAWNFEPGS
jgi:membrane protease YdiL (CAAX protease family)